MFAIERGDFDAILSRVRPVEEARRRVDGEAVRRVETGVDDFALVRAVEKGGGDRVLIAVRPVDCV